MGDGGEAGEGRMQGGEGWHKEEQESNEVGRQVEGRKSVGGEEVGEVQVGWGVLL